MEKLTTLENTARELFAIYRSTDPGSRIWWELKDEERDGWRKIAKLLMKSDPSFKTSFQEGDLVRAKYNIGELLMVKDGFEDGAEVFIGKGDRGGVYAIDYNEPQPLTIRWGKGPINDCFLDEVEHDIN